ncbi:MAG: stage V sporulation protein K, partial [Bacillota bacterium]|nr:stage V sporulation protein K [Bacillota bacterium]
MDQPIRMKSNGQITISLNSQRRVLPKELPDFQVVPKDIPPEHSALKEIEEELGALVGMNEMKRMIKEIYAWIYVNKKREEIGLKAGKQAL